MIYNNLTGNGTYGGKKFKMKSETQPGQGVDIQDVMTRAEQGLPIPQSRFKPIYGDDDDFIPVTPDMDISEIHALTMNASDYMRRSAEKETQEATEEKKPLEAKQEPNSE